MSTAHETSAPPWRLVHMRSTLLMLAGLGTACTPETECPPGSSLNSADGLCYLNDHGDDSGLDGGSDDTGGGSGGDSGGDSGDDGGLDGFELGDPIETIATVPAVASSGIIEWTDAAMLDADHALMVGQGGWAVVDMEDGQWVSDSYESRAYRVDVDEGFAIIGQRDNGLRIMDFNDPTSPVETARTPPATEFHEDVAISGDVVAVGFQAEGVVIYNEDLNELAQISADRAFAVAIDGDRLVYSASDELILVDISNPSSPTELHRVETTGEGRDLDWTDGRVALAMGGAGAAVFTVEDDTLVHQGDVTCPGSTFSVALDDDYLWLGSWEVSALAWLGGDEPVIVGHELPTHSAMGLAAEDGRAAVADWLNQTVLARIDGVAGPEVVVKEQVITAAEGGSTSTLSFSNQGAMDLELTVDEAEDGWTWEAGSWTLGPGDSKTLALTTPSSGSSRTDLTWTSNDPDETSGTVAVKTASGSVGQTHPPIELTQFTWPETTTSLSNWRAEDNDQVVLLVYFALY